MVDSPNFEPYLRSLIEHNAQWREFYTSTEASQLTVQVVQSEVEEQPPDLQKKIERWSVLEGIRKYAATHVLLSGRPGSGKSTALRRLLLEEAEQSLQEFQTIPVLVELRSGKPISELIKSTFRRHCLRISAEQIDELLFEGKLLLLLDGVNEIPTDELLVQVEEFRGDNLATPMILTTRDLGMGGDLRIEKKLIMEPLNSEQMRQFVGKYLPSEQGKSLLQQLGDRLKELGETPLLLKMLCDVFELKQEIPKSKGELFRWVDQEYDRLKGLTTLAPELRHWSADLLQRLAFEMMQGNNPTKLDLTLLRTDAIAIFEAFLQERGVTDFGQKARVWLEDLQKYHLLQRSVDQKIEFHHQLFQEYYAAEYLLQRLLTLSDAVLQRKYLNYLKWTEPLSLMLGLVEDDWQALRVVRSALTVDLRLGVRLAEDVRWKVRDRTILLLNNLDVIPSLRKVLLSINDKDIQVLERTMDDLERMMNDINSLSQKYVVGNTGYLLATTILDEKTVLLRALSPCLPDVLRMDAIRALKGIATEKVLSVLEEALNEDHVLISRESAQVLQELETDGSVQMILARALKSEIPFVRLAAAKALSKIGTPEVIQQLWQLKTYGMNMVIVSIKAIASIQSRCKFYNYEIEAERKVNNIIHPTTNLRTILILAASPTDQVRLRLDQEARDIDESLRRSLHRDRFTLQSQWAVRPKDLRRAILDHNPQIVHFCGHGEGKQGIVLENETGKSQLVSTEAISDLFKLFADKGLECVVLNACYSEVQANAIVQHIPYVIGMSDAILDKTAPKFAVGFYDALGAGWSYEQAFEMGKSAIAIEGIPEADLPVLKQK